MSELTQLQRALCETQGLYQERRCRYLREDGTCREPGSCLVPKRARDMAAFMATGHVPSDPPVLDLTGNIPADGRQHPVYAVGQGPRRKGTQP